MTFCFKYAEGDDKQTLVNELEVEFNVLAAHGWRLVGQSACGRGVLFTFAKEITP